KTRREGRRPTAPERIGRRATKRTWLGKIRRRKARHDVKSRRCALRALPGPTRAGLFSWRPSEECNGITIERHPKLCLLGPRNPLEEMTHQPRQIARMFGFEQNVPAPAILDPVDRTWCWTDNREPRNWTLAQERVNPCRRRRSQTRRRGFRRPAEHD